MFKSLKFKISATAFILVSIIMTASTWRDIKDTEQKLLIGQKEKTALLSDRIAHGIMVLMLNNRWKDLQTMMVGLIRDSRDLKEIRIFLPDEKGTIVVSSHPEELGNGIYHGDRERFLKKDFEPFVLSKNDTQYSSKLTPIMNQTACHKCHGTEKEVLGVLDVELSLTGIESSIKKLKKQHLTDALIGFSLITGAFLLVVGILIDRPISRMIKTLRKIEKGDLSSRMDEKKKDEFGLLAKSFNDMLESLEAAKAEIEHCHLEEMQKASRLASLGEIISGISHEIKNPLAGISCAVQVIQSELGPDEKKKAVTNEILTQISRLDKVVKDLLNFAKPKPPQFLQGKIGEVMDMALFFIYPEAKKQDIKIETSIANDLPEMRIDLDQMQQVFLNLMINALQASEKGGKLHISIELKDSREIEKAAHLQTASDKVVEIRFRDTGRGISPEDIHSIFEPFFTRKKKGTGLGLFISRKIVQEHGGEITVDSIPGRGSIFTVYLPLLTKKTV